MNRDPIFRTRALLAIVASVGALAFVHSKLPDTENCNPSINPARWLGCAVDGATAPRLGDGVPGPVEAPLQSPQVRP